MACKIVASNGLGELLQKAGVLPSNCRRFVIDSGEPGGLLKVYWECFADERILEAFTQAGIGIREPETEVKRMPKQQPDWVG